MKKYRILILLTLVTAKGWAEQYAVQIEASKSPQLQHYEALKVHGNLYTGKASNGYIWTRLGSYENKSRALDILKEVHAAGYNNAIITVQKSNNITSLSGLSKPTKHQYEIENFDVKTLKEWKMLTADQQANLVYLDGELHVKNGDKFIPLVEIIKQN